MLVVQIRFFLYLNNLLETVWRGVCSIVEFSIFNFQFSILQVGKLQSNSSMNVLSYLLVH